MPWVTGGQIDSRDERGGRLRPIIHEGVRGKGSDVAGRRTVTGLEGDRVSRPDNSVLVRLVFHLAPSLRSIKRRDEFRWCNRCGGGEFWSRERDHKCCCAEPIWFEYMTDETCDAWLKKVTKIGTSPIGEKAIQIVNVEDRKGESDLCSGRIFEIVCPVHVMKRLVFDDLSPRIWGVALIEQTLSVGAPYSGQGSAGAETTQRKQYKQLIREQKMSKEMKRIERDARYVEDEIEDRAIMVDVPMMPGETEGAYKERYARELKHAEDMERARLRSAKKSTDVIGDIARDALIASADQSPDTLDVTDVLDAFASCETENDAELVRRALHEAEYNERVVMRPVLTKSQKRKMRRQKQEGGEIPVPSDNSLQQAIQADRALTPEENARLSERQKEIGWTT